MSGATGIGRLPPVSVPCYENEHPECSAEYREWRCQCECHAGSEAGPIRNSAVIRAEDHLLPRPSSPTPHTARA